MSSTTPVGLGPEIIRGEDRQVRLRRVAEAFEALMVQSLFKRMREAQLQEGLFGDGPGASIYEGLFDTHLSERIARDSPFGIADLLEAQWEARLNADPETAQAIRKLDAEKAEIPYGEALMGIPAKVPGGGADE